MNKLGEAATVFKNDTVTEATLKLTNLVRIDTALKAAKRRVEALQAELTSAKEEVKDLFVDMGVKQMKVGKTVYLSRSVFAGIAENVTNLQVAKALEKLDLGGHVTFNHQSMSSYVREIAKDHEDWVNADGEITATPEQIVSALPEPLNRLLKVTDKIDIRVRN